MNFLIAFLASFALALLFAPLVIKLAKKFKASQTILHYVEAHKSKEGTPTMGGFIFILPTALVSLFFFKTNFSLALVLLASMLGFGVLGFLDDFIKIKFRQNEGLKPYQKIIGQLGIATIISFFVYTSGSIGTNLVLPFSMTELDLGWLIIPFVIFVFIAVSNSVNLIDGLDGLAGSTSLFYILGFGTIVYLFYTTRTGLDPTVLAEQTNMLIVASALVGALTAFLIFNSNPASIFMGDTGSLALGGFIASLSIFSRLELLMPIIGLVFVVTVVSDILQVLHYKRTKKRIFLMAPLHHHFEKKGVHENKIVVVYIVVTIILSLAVLLITKLVGAI